MSIFISYSRRDAGFVRSLHEALVARGRETWVDWEGIPPTADWMAQIRAAIDAAEAVVFVISPDSAASAVCAQEVDHAVAQHKRLIPVLRRMVEPSRVPPALARLNWIYFRADDDADAALATLLEGVDTDLDRVAAHTRLLLRAVEWERRGDAASLGLRGDDLDAAERWLAEGAAKAPAPTTLQTRYVLASRREATRRRTALLGGVAAALVVAATLGTLYWLQRGEAEKQQAVATARRLAAVSDRLRTQPVAVSPGANRLQLAVAFAAEALARVRAVGQPSLEADTALRRALAGLPPRPTRLEPNGTQKDFDVVGYDDRGGLVAASRYLSTTAVWQSPSRPLTWGGEGAESAAGVVLSADGCCIAVVAPDRAGAAVDVRDARTRELIASARHAAPGPAANGIAAGAASAAAGSASAVTGATNAANAANAASGAGAASASGSIAAPSDRFVAGSVALAPGASHLLGATAAVDPRTGREVATTRLWALPGWRELARLPELGSPVVSRDGAWLAALAGPDRRPSVWSMADLRAGLTTPLAVLDLPPGDATGPVFSSDGSRLAVAFGSEPVRVALWDAGDWQRPPRLLAGGAIAALGPGGRLLALQQLQGGSALLRIVATADGREVARLSVPAATYHGAVAFDPGGRSLAVATGYGVEVADIDRGAGDVVRRAAPTGSVAVGFAGDSADGAHAAADDGADLRVLVRGGDAPAAGWRLLAGDADPASGVDLGPADVAAFGADGGHVVLGGATGLRVVDAADGRLAWRGAGASGLVGVALDAEARQAVGVGPGGLLQLWQAGSAAPAASAALPGAAAGRPPALAIDGGSVSVVGTDGRVSRSGQALALHTFAAPRLDAAASSPLGRDRSGLAVAVCALSADGRRLAIDQAGARVTIRDAAERRDVGSVDEAGGRPTCRFSADGRLLAVAGDRLRVWDVASRSEIAALDLGAAAADAAAPPRALAFDRAGGRLAALQPDGTLAVWRLDPGDLLERACRVADDTIAPADWERFVGTEPQRWRCAPR